jgi:hypothetical protein
MKVQMVGFFTQYVQDICGYVYWYLWWLICASYNLSSFRFVEAKKRQDGKTIIIVFSPRKDDKTTRRQNEKSTKLVRKDDKHNPLLSDLICRLFAWRFVVLSSFHLEKTTERQDNKTKRRQIVDWHKSATIFSTQNSNVKSDKCI